jgi:hypothetical protein
VLSVIPRGTKDQPWKLSTSNRLVRNTSTARLEKTQGLEASSQFLSMADGMSPIRSAWKRHEIVQRGHVEGRWKYLRQNGDT